MAQVDRERQVEHRLAQSQKLEALGVLAGGIAHDFNNILTAIMGFAEVGLRDSETNPRLLKCFNGTQKAGLRAGELTAQILAFSRRGEERRIPVDVIGVVDEVLVLMRASIPALIDIKRTVVPERSFYILGDASRLHQVLMNLCTNAYQAIGENRGTVSVDISEKTVVDPFNVEANLQPGRYVKIVVSDTGCGIPPEVLPRIFDPFFTARSNGQGTGMGLSVVHGIVLGLEGAINVSSEVGKGSSFEVLLPQCTNLLTEETVGAVEAHTGSGRVLLVDDEELIITGLKDLLESVGYTVTAIMNPELALEVFNKDPQFFDILLTDQSMPKMTGLDLIKAVRAIRGDLPVILSTGYSREATEETVLRLGIQGFIKKPYSFSQLEKILAQTLEQSRRGRV
jgi:nitrogen-specific signal transduction histidine kinase/ActR/RegA family two-component response regulator